MPQLSAATEAAVAPVLPATHRQLPFDFGMLNHAGETDPAVAGGAVGLAVDRAMADPAVGAGILLLTTQPQQERVVEAAIAAANRSGKPLLFVQGAGNHGQVARDMLREAGHGYFDSTHDALKVAAVLSLREEPEPATPLAPAALPADLPSGFLTEPDARRLLESAGIPTTPWRLAHNAAQAVDAARELGGPVVIKAVSARIVHKSDVGGVKLGIEGDEAVRQACDEIAAAARTAGVAELDGFLVTQMWRADTELIAGVQRDPDFGPLVMVGAGGVLVELLRDVQLAPAPLSHAAARAMVERLRCLPLLTGYRGRPKADLDRIADVLVRLGQMAAAEGSRLRELDINPLFIAGDRVAAADARATLA